MLAHAIDLEPGEKVIKQVRRHMFVFLSRMAFDVVVALLPLAVLAPAANFVNTYLTGSFGGAIVGGLYTLWLLVLWITFFFQWTDYYLDVWVITDKRIFDIDQKGMFHREISVFRHENIQDITIEVKGLLATFLQFGDVHIHTAGEKPDLIIRDAARPLDVKKVIMDTHDSAIGERYSQAAAQGVPPPGPLGV